jgi:hypothetical protein
LITQLRDKQTLIDRNKDKNNKVVENIDAVLSDENAQFIYDEIKKKVQEQLNPDKQLKVLRDESEFIIDSNIKIQALWDSLSAIDVSINRISTEIKNLRDLPDQKEAFRKLNYFNKSLNSWKTALNEIKREFLNPEIGFKPDNPIINDLDSLLNKIEINEKAQQDIKLKALVETLQPEFEELNKSVNAQIDAEIKRLKEKKGVSEKEIKRRIEIEEEKRTKFIVDKDKMLAYITGQMGDIGMWNAQFENFISNQDPSVASLMKYIKRMISDADIDINEKYNKFAQEINKLFEAANLNPKNLKQFKEKTSFVDLSFTYDDKGNLVPFKVNTLMTKEKNHKYTKGLMKDALDKAIADKESNPTEENINRYNQLYALMQEHNNLFFKNTYKQSYLNAKNVLGSTPLGAEVQAKRNSLFEEIDFQKKQSEDSIDVLDSYDQIASLEKQLRNMSSLYDEYGNKKEGDELKKAELLIEHNKRMKPFIEYELNEGQFEKAYQGYLIKVKEQIKSIYPNTESEEYKNELEKRLDLWIQNNTKQEIDQSFWKAKKNIITQIQKLLGKTNELNSEYLEIVDLLVGEKDKNNQPIGTEMTNEKLLKIQQIEQAIEEQKQKSKNSTELSPNDRTLLNGLFKALDDLQLKRPTDYYLDIVNEYVYDKHKIEITLENANDLLNPGFIEPILEENSEFKEWFNRNHIKVEKWQESSKSVETLYQRTAAWNITVPKNDKHYKKTDVYDENNKFYKQINGTPNIRYYSRSVKKEYLNNYDEKTGMVDDSKLNDFLGNRLPKTKEEIQQNINDDSEFQKKLEAHGQKFEKFFEGSFDSKMSWDYYVNHKYYELNEKEIAAIDAMKEYHLSNQVGLEQTKKMGLEIGRFRKDGNDIIRNTELNKFFPTVAKNIKDRFAPAVDDAQQELNFELQNTAAKLSLYTNDESKVPISGKEYLDIDQVTDDIMGSLFRYGYSAIHNKYLVEAQPIAKAFKELLNSDEFKPHDLKRMGKMIAAGNNQIIHANTNNRGKVAEGMYEIFFEGKVLNDYSAQNKKAVKFLNVMSKMASHTFFAFDITSAMKNHLGAVWQIALEGAGKKYFSWSNWQMGRPWANLAMWTISSEIYQTGPKSLKTQMVMNFDAVQGYMEGKFGTTMSRTATRDALNLKFPTAHRSWLELEASLQLFSAIMHDTKIEQIVDGKSKMIRYVDAWMLNEEGIMTLKPGIDKKWGLKGNEFLNIKSKVHEVSAKLQGAYAAMEQPLIARNLFARSAFVMKKFFTRMFINRFAFKGKFINPQDRFDLGTQSLHMGFYIRSLNVLKEAWTTRGKNLLYLNKEEKRAVKMMFLEFAKLYALNLLYGLLWGYDADDPDRWKKRKGQISTGAYFEGSGALPTPLTDEKWSKDFNAHGWLGNHLLLLMMNVEAENEHFIPLPKYGLKDMYNILIGDTHIAASSSMGQVIELIQDISQTVSGENRQYYSNDQGALLFQQKGQNKFYMHLAKMAGLKGKGIDPATAMKKMDSSRKAR